MKYSLYDLTLLPPKLFVTPPPFCAPELTFFLILLTSLVSSTGITRRMLIRKLPISTPSSSSFSSSFSSFPVASAALFPNTGYWNIFHDPRPIQYGTLCHVEYSIGFRVTRAIYPLFVHAFYDDDSLSNTRETTNPIIIVLWSFSIDVILFPFFLPHFFPYHLFFFSFSRNVSIFFQSYFLFNLFIFFLIKLFSV